MHERDTCPGERGRLASTWRWWRLHLVGIERRDEELLIDVLHLSGDAIYEGSVQRGYPMTLTFVTESQSPVEQLEAHVTSWLASDVPVMDCFAPASLPRRIIVLVHHDDHLVLQAPTTA